MSIDTRATIFGPLAKSETIDWMYAGRINQVIPNSPITLKFIPDAGTTEFHKSFFLGILLFTLEGNSVHSFYQRIRTQSWDVAYKTIDNGVLASTVLPNSPIANARYEVAMHTKFVRGFTNEFGALDTVGSYQVEASYYNDLPS